MNIHGLTPTEASFLLFSIKRTLRDPDGLTPDMRQFYESTSHALSEKLKRVSRSGSGNPEPPERHRFVKDENTWLANSLKGVPRSVSGDS